MKPSNPQYKFADDSTPAVEVPFTFESLPVKDQIEKYEYVNFGYIEKQPGYIKNIDDNFSSYVGVYWDYAGRKTIGSN